MDAKESIHFENGWIYAGDARVILEKLPESSLDSCITSPPYWGMRDYGYDNQIGAENDVNAYISDLVGIFRQIRRVLKDSGTLWLNIGDTYTSGNRKWRDDDKKNKGRGMKYRPATPEGLKPKDLIGLPWRLAFALQADGWFLRSDIIWNKPNCQPESVKDRPTRAHEYIFLLTKEKDYYYNGNAIMEPALVGNTIKNRRTVWNINTEPYKEAHFATFPRELVRLCMLAGCPDGGTVIDPFLGSGTVAEVATLLQRRFVGIELKDEYVQLAQRRIQKLGSRLFLTG
jgi:site-specific DNA-methyltransferase (cytosine-N4-specific)